MKRVRLALAVLVGVGVAFGALMMLGWTIDETHFDRPDKGFDRLAAEIERTPGVNIDMRERWVEAPTFSNPSSWMQLTVDAEHLPDLLAIACTREYDDAVAWSLRVTTGNGSVVSLYSGAAPGDGDTRCPDFGFDAVGLVEEIGTSIAGMDLQAAIWDDGRFALSVVDDDNGTLSDLLPLVDHADEIRDAAGLAERQSVQVDGAALSVVIQSGEHDLALALLPDLAGKHGVTNLWADGGTPSDGVEKVQVVAPDHEHAAVEDAIRTSGLHLADLPVRFLTLDP